MRDVYRACIESASSCSLHVTQGALWSEALLSFIDKVAMVLCQCYSKQHQSHIITQPAVENASNSLTQHVRNGCIQHSPFCFGRQLWKSVKLNVYLVLYVRSNSQHNSSVECGVSS